MVAAGVPIFGHGANLTRPGARFRARMPKSNSAHSARYRLRCGGRAAHAISHRHAQVRLGPNKLRLAPVPNLVNDVSVVFYL